MTTTDQPSTASLIESLREGASSLHGKDFLLTWDHGVIALKAVINAATILEAVFKGSARTPSAKLFDSGLALALFRDKSTRTRFAFASAANLLGLSVQELDEEKSQIAHGETVRETATMISFTAQAIGIRDDMFIDAPDRGHRYMVEVAGALDEGVREGVLPNRPALVNLQCDVDHPTQSMADLLHLVNTFGGIDKLRGKKLAMSWAHSPSYGKPLSVPQGIITLMTRFGMDVVLAYPEGYDLSSETIDIAKRHADGAGCEFKITHSMEDAFADADIVYPKSWAPLWVMEERTRMLRNGESKQLETLEKECLETNAKHESWECTADLMKVTKDGEALYMHCLPADITGVSCDAGEVTAEVFERYRIRTYLEAGHKPYIIAAMILLSRCADVPSFLSGITE